MIKYYKLFDMLNRRNMKKTDLLEVVSRGTLSKLSKGENLQTDVIDKICLFLGCQPGDIMECIYDHTSEENTTIITMKKVYNDLNEESEEVIDLVQNPRV